jgi:broad specificity phosphatase PhoE
MKLVVICRPEINMEAGTAGQSEAPSPRGEEQLLQLREFCRSQGVQAVVHSIRLRASIAAECLSRLLGVPAIPQEGLEERNFGDWNKWEWSKIAAELGQLSTAERYTFLPAGGESWQQLEERLQAALTDIASLGYDSVAVMTHWSPIRSILQMLRGEPREAALQYNAARGECYVEEYNLYKNGCTGNCNGSMRCRDPKTNCQHKPGAS